MEIQNVRGNLTCKTEDPTEIRRLITRVKVTAEFNRCVAASHTHGMARFILAGLHVEPIQNTPFHFYFILRGQIQAGTITEGKALGLVPAGKHHKKVCKIVLQSLVDMLVEMEEDNEMIIKETGDDID